MMPEETLVETARERGQIILVLPLGCIAFSTLVVLFLLAY